MKKLTIFDLKTTKVLVIIGAVFLAYSQAFSASNSQVGRYSTVENKPTIAQVNPLLSVQKMHFPAHVKTVGEAVRYWVRFSGYSLVLDKSLSKEVVTLLGQPLPVVDKSLGPLSVKDGIEVLMGQGVFHLVQDPLNRKLDFNLDKKYSVLYGVKEKRRG